MNKLCPTCSHPMYRHIGTIDLIRCVDCGAICGDRSTDYRGTEERVTRRHTAECRGGPADGTQFSFEGPPPSPYYIPNMPKWMPDKYDAMLPGGGVGLIDDVFGTDGRFPLEPWRYRPVVTSAGYARNAQWRYIYEFCGGG